MRSICLTALDAADAESLSAELADVDPWLKLGVGQQRLLASLQPAQDGNDRFGIVQSGRTVGVMVVSRAWLAGPYLRLLAIVPSHQGQGLGGEAMALLEQQAIAQKAPNIWLCVSAFNAGARRFYESLGFAKVAVIDDLLVSGEDEILMRKRLTVRAPAAT